MDTDQEDTRLVELREALRRMPNVADTVIGPPIKSVMPEQLSLDFSWSWSDQLSALTTDTIPSLTTDQITALDWHSISHPILGSTQAGAPFTISGTLNDSLNIGPRSSSKITLEGADADIEINGESVVSVLRDIRDRLGILKVSEEMEREWDDLRALREQYEAKLTECRSKSAMMEALRKMPRPNDLI